MDIFSAEISCISCYRTSAVLGNAVRTGHTNASLPQDSSLQS